MREKRKKKAPPSPYDTLPYYFPTEQIDVVKKKMKTKKQFRKRK